MGVCRQSSWRHRLRVLGLAGGMLLGVVSTAVLAGQGLFEAPMTIQGFTMRDVNPDGSPSWQIRGETAVLRGNIAALEGVDVLFDQDGGPLRLQSPQCTFDRVKKVGWSDAELQLLGETMIIRGVGYDLLADQKKLIVHQQVHVTFRPTPAASPARQAAENIDTIAVQNKEHSP